MKNFHTKDNGSAMEQILEENHHIYSHRRSWTSLSNFFESTLNSVASWQVVDVFRLIETFQLLSKLADFSKAANDIFELLGW